MPADQGILNCLVLKNPIHSFFRLNMQCLSIIYKDLSFGACLMDDILP